MVDNCPLHIISILEWRWQNNKVSECRIIPKKWRQEIVITINTLLDLCFNH